VIVPIEKIDQAKHKKIDWMKLAAFGMWKDRKDMKDSAKWVAKLRHRMSSRYGYGKLFS